MPKKKQWMPRIDGCIAHIPLTQGLMAKIDVQDIGLVDEMSWYACRAKKTFYACAMIKGQDGSRRQVSMHRLLTGFEMTDHKDGDGLNNLRENLRECCASQNNRNRRIGKSNKTGYKGVYWSKSAQKYIAQIRIDKKAIYLGSFDFAKDAYRAYCQASNRYHAEFGSLS